MEQKPIANQLSIHSISPPTLQQPKHQQTKQKRQEKKYTHNERVTTNKTMVIHDTDIDIHP